MTDQNKQSLSDLFKEHAIRLAVEEIVRFQLKPLVEQFEKHANHITLSVSVGYDSRITARRPRVYEIRNVQTLKEMKEQIVQDSAIFGIPTHISYFIIDDENYVMNKNPYLVIPNYRKAMIKMSLGLVAFTVFMIALLVAGYEIIDEFILDLWE